MVPRSTCSISQNEAMEKKYSPCGECLSFIKRQAHATMDTWKQYSCSAKRLTLFVKEVRIYLSKMLPFFRNCRLFKNGCHRTCRFARATVDALIGIDEKLLSLLKTRLTL